MQNTHVLLIPTGCDAKYVPSGIVVDSASVISYTCLEQLGVQPSSERSSSSHLRCGLAAACTGPMLVHLFMPFPSSEMEFEVALVGV